MVVKEKEREYGFDSANTALAGCILLGAGVGVMIDQFFAGALIGAGAGFIVMSVLKTIGR